MLKPLKDKVLIQHLEPEMETKSGLFIPEIARKESRMATVLAVGPTVREVKLGDLVACTKWDGIKLKDNCVMILEHQLLGIIEK